MKYLFLTLFFITSLLSSSQINCVDVKKLPSVSSLNDTTIFPIDSVFHTEGDIKLFQARPHNWISSSTQYLSFDTLTGEMFFIGSIGIDVSSSTYSCKKLTYKFVQDRVVIDGDTLYPTSDTTIVYPNWTYKSVSVLGVSQVTITGSFNKVVIGQSTNILSNICLDSCLPIGGISSCIDVKKLPSVSSLNDTTIFPIGSVFHTQGDIKLFQARPHNWISSSTQYLSFDTLTGEMFFIGSIGIDVSSSTYSCKKLTFKFVQDRVVIDGDTLYPSSDTTIVYPNWTYKSVSVLGVSQVTITGSFNKVIIGQSTNILSNICLDSCLPTGGISSCIDVKKLPSVSSLNDTTIFPIGSVFHSEGDIKLFQARPHNWISSSTQYLSFDTLTGELFFIGSIGIDVSSSTYSCKKLTYKFVQDRVIIDGDTLYPTSDTTIVYPNWKYNSVSVLGVSQVSITGSFNKVIIGQSTNILSNICLDSCSKNLTAIDETGFSQKLESLSVYPNPTDGLVHIQFSNKGNYSIFSLDGKMVVENKRIETELTTLNISSLNPGMYLLKLITEEGNVMTKRIVKQ